MPADVTVLVVGAGPTGLLLAAELCRRGVRCRLVDANPAPLHWDRATVIHPRSLEVFESLGLHDGFLAAGVKQRFARLHSDGKVLGEIDLSICGSRYAFNLGLSEEVTETILTDYLHRQGGEIIRSSGLVGLKTNESGVVATIERNGATEHLSAQWVVGCDGLHSATRELTGIRLAGHDIEEPWAVFDVTLTGWPDSYEAIFGYMDAPPVILTALPQRRWRVYLRPSSPDCDLVADAAATIHRYHPAIVFDDVANPTRFHCHTKVARQFRSARVLLAGDAAHVCSPFQGHGMNTGIQDAFNLAWKLALVCQGHCTTRILDSYEAERRPVAEMIAASGDEVEHAQTLSNPVERRARDKTLRAVFADPKSRHHEAIAEAEFNIDYGNSPIVMGDAHQALAPGQRLPDTIEVVLASGAKCGLHALTHRAGHTALVVGGAFSRDDDLARVFDLVRTHSDGPFIDETIAVTTRSAQHSSVRLVPAAAEQLGAEAVALLVVRPDGYIGLRADRDHLDALTAYHSLLASGRTSDSP
jgi:2-polyprenyl-6-methoxyphenol hydroxylase-like FAD-dependent oxidoreductase